MKWSEHEGQTRWGNCRVCGLNIRVHKDAELLCIEHRPPPPPYASTNAEDAALVVLTPEQSRVFPHLVAEYLHMIHNEAVVKRACHYSAESKALAYAAFDRLVKRRNEVAAAFGEVNPGACCHCDAIGKWVQDPEQWKVGVRVCSVCGTKQGEALVPRVFWDNDAV